MATSDKIEIKVTADTREATASLARFSDKAKDAAESAGRIAAGVAGGIAAIGAATYKIAEFAASVEQQQMAINRLGPAYDAVRAATNGVVSAQDALKAQQTLVQSGLRVSAEQLGTITRAAREYARATGTETTQALEQLTDALRTGSSEGLGRFGVSLQQGVTGAAAYTSALAQMTSQQERTTVSARTMREDLDKLPEGLSAIGTSILSMLQGPGDALIGWLTGLGGASMNLRGLLSEIAGAGDTLRQRERQAATDAANMRRLEAQEGLFRTVGAAGLSLSREQVRGLSPERLARLRQSATRVGQVQTFAMAGLSTRGAEISMRRPMGGALGVLRGMEQQGEFMQDLERLQAEQRAEEEASRRPAHGPTRRPAARAGGGAARATPQGPRSVDELLASLFGERTLEDGFTQAEARLRGLMSSTLGAVSDPSMFDEILGAGPAAQERGPREQSFGERVLRAAGISVDEETGRLGAFDALQGGVELLQGSLQTLTSGFSQLFNTLASGSMSAGEAFQQFAAKTLSSLGEMAVNKGVFYTFEGIASLFSNPVAAPLYFAAGAGLIALGVGLGAAGSAVAPSTGASAGSSAPAAARAASGASPRSDSGGGNVTIVLSSLVPPGPRELQGLVHAQRQAGRYGLDDARMVPRQVRA